METQRIDRPREPSSVIVGRVCLIEGRLTSGPGHDAERIEQFGPGVGQHRLTGRLHQDRRQQMGAIVGVVKVVKRGVVLMLQDEAHPVRRRHQFSQLNVPGIGEARRVGEQLPQRDPGDARGHLRGVPRKHLR